MKSNQNKIKTFLLLAGTSLVLASCAGTDANHDPYEDFNRSVFAFNKAVNDTILHPTIEVYRAVVPNPLRTGLKNFLYNLKSPVRFVNQLLQGDLDGAGNEFVRASVNTFVGVAGLFDVAAYEGYEPESEDFGQTLGVWGVDHGPYIVVPFIGPSTLRDYVGFAVDSFFDPLRFYTHNIDEEHIYYTKVGLDYFMLRNDLKDLLEELEASSIDYYAAVRSTYFQNRAAMLADDPDNPTAVPSIPDYDDEDF